MARKKKGGPRRNDGSSQIEDKPYRVGYGCPPTETQFKPHQSGNASGRPKGRKSESTLIRDVLLKKVRVNDGGVVRSRPKIVVATKVHLNKALKGDGRSYEKMMDIAERFGVLREILPELPFSIIRRVIIDPRDKS